MKQHIAHFTIVVNDYDETLKYYIGLLGFELVEDAVIDENKRCVLVQPKGSENGCKILLAKADNPEQQARIGNQTGGRVLKRVQSLSALVSVNHMERFVYSKIYMGIFGTSSSQMMALPGEFGLRESRAPIGSCISLL